MTPTDRPTRLLFALSGLALFGYLALRPWAGGDTSAAWAHPLWPLSHLLAVVGFVAYAAIGARRAGRPGAVLAGVAVATLLPYYGAEAYALPVLDALPPDQSEALAQAFRYGPIPMLTFAIGWIALGALAILTARTLRTPRLAGRLALVVHTVAMLAWLPVFFLPPAGRLLHAALVLASALVLAFVPASGAQDPRPVAESHDVATPNADGPEMTVDYARADAAPAK